MISKAGTSRRGECNDADLLPTLKADWGSFPACADAAATNAPIDTLGVLGRLAEFNRL